MDPFRKLTKLKTLLVEDDDLIRDALSLAFMNKGCFLLTTETAEEGLRVLERESFDIIISDFKLPGINGLEFLKQVAVSQPNTVKVLITAYGGEDVVSQAFGIGVHDFIDKPFSVKKFVTSLAMLVEKHNEMIYKPDEEAQLWDERKTQGKLTTDDTGPGLR